MKMQRRRRQENKTDYSKRIKFLKSGLSRIVFRKTNRYIIAQFVISSEAQDFLKQSITSKELLKYGWPKELHGSLKSLPASYLTGFLIGNKIKENKLLKKSEKVVVDSGMIKKVHKNRFFAFLKGLKDSEIEIECSEKFFPDENRLKGKHLKKDFSKFFEEIKQKISKGK